MNAWEVVDREDYINVIKSTWAFKLKLYPYGWIIKFQFHLRMLPNTHLQTDHSWPDANLDYFLGLWLLWLSEKNSISLMVKYSVGP